ncbi:MAG: hypothetical protein CMK59_02100 [Proteobacteria bacterium]|nr:hypothetical protein [Pseudomonadota bacterium]
MNNFTEFSLVFKAARQKLYTSQAALVADLKAKGVDIDIEVWKCLEKGTGIPSKKRLAALCTALHLPHELLAKLLEWENKRAQRFYTFQQKSAGRIRLAQEYEEKKLFQFLPKLILERHELNGDLLWSSIPIYCSGYKTSLRRRISLPLCNLIGGWVDGSLHHKDLYWLLRFQGEANSAHWIAYDPRQQTTVRLDGMLYHAIMGSGPIMKMGNSRSFLRDEKRLFKGTDMEHLLYRESLGTFLLYKKWSKDKDFIYWADGSTEELEDQKLKALRGQYLETLEEQRLLINRPAKNWRKKHTQELFEQEHVNFGDLIVTPWSIEYSYKDQRLILMVANRPLSAPVLLYCLNKCREKLEQKVFSLWAYSGLMNL